MELLKNKFGKNDLMKPIVGIVILSSFIFILSVLLFVEIPPANEKYFVFIFGIITASMSRLDQYYYGSSKSSQDKTEMLNRNKDEKPS